MLTFERAEALQAAGEWSDAAVEFRKLLASPGDAEAQARLRVRLAECLIETCAKGEADEAEECLAEARRAIEASPDLSLRGDYALQRGRLYDLQANLKRALGSYVQARELLEMSGSDVTRVDIVLAGAERRRGELTKALARLERIDAAELPGRLKAEWLDEYGSVHLARGDTTAAIDTLEQALEIDKSETNDYTAGRSQLLLAEAYLRRGLRPKAKQLIEGALRVYSQERSVSGLSEANALLAFWYEEAEDYSNAVHYYQKGFELDRSSEDVVGQARAKRSLGRVFRKKGDSSRAQEYFDEAHNLLSKDDDVERASLLTEQGHLALGGSDPDYGEAIDRFNEALAIAIEDGDERAVAVAKRNLAKALKEAHDLPAAEQLLREARPLLESRGDLRELDDLLDDLGEVLLDRDRYQDALECLEDSLKLDRELGTVGSQGRTLLLLGRAHLQLGDREPAGESFKEALEVYERAENDVGRSAALHELGSWYAEEGNLTEAIRCFRQGLSIDSRQEDRIGVVRANRSLAAVYRRRGDLSRADELLDEAEQELRGVDDQMERALLLVERGRLALAEGSHREARDRLQTARDIFQARSNSPAQVATCQRLLAQAALDDGDSEEALRLLELARHAFEEANDKPELDELYDDLGMVYLQTGRLAEAERAVRSSLDIGRRMGWRHGRGRSLLLLGEIAMRQGDFSEAFKHLQAALSLFTQIKDEVGSSDANRLMADWYCAEGNPERDLHRALASYKDARVFDQAHRDLRGLARCNIRIARVHRLNGQLYRAEEALEQAEDNLRGIDDPRELTPLEFEFGALRIARGEHAVALPYLRRALQGYKRLQQPDDVRATYQLLVTAYQSTNNVRDALECLREMGSQHASMWNVLVKDLEPAIATASHEAFADGRYGLAVTAAFQTLEQEFKRRAARLHAPPKPTSDISNLINSWVERGEDVPTFAKAATRVQFGNFCTAAFDLLRNEVVHGSADISETDAFAALAVAHVIAKQLARGADRQES